MPSIKIRGDTPAGSYDLRFTTNLYDATELFDAEGNSVGSAKVLIRQRIPDAHDPAEADRRAPCCDPPEKP